MNDDLKVHEMHYDKDGLNLKLGGQTAMLFLSTLVDMFEANGGKNFLTMTVHKDEIKYAITIQNCNGKDSPSEKLERYQQAIQESLRRLKQGGSGSRTFVVETLEGALVGETDE